MHRISSIKRRSPIKRRIKKNAGFKKTPDSKKRRIQKNAGSKPSILNRRREHLNEERRYTFL